VKHKAVNQKLDNSLRGLLSSDSAFDVSRSGISRPKRNELLQQLSRRAAEAAEEVCAAV